MRWFQAGLALRLNVHLQVDELPVQADGGTVAWQMRDQTGAIVGDPERTGVASGTTAVLEISSSDMTVIAGNETEARYLLVRFAVDGNHQEQRLSFGLTPFLPIEADAQTVRSVLGISGEELPTEDVDVISAYYTLAEAYGAKFIAGLSSGKAKVRSAINKAIAIKAAIDLIPSLQLRTYQTSQNENALFTRFRGIDWDKLLADLEGKLAESLTDADLGGDPTEKYQAIFIVSNPTDPVTGQ